MLVIHNHVPNAFNSKEIKTQFLNNFERFDILFQTFICLFRKYVFIDTQTVTIKYHNN